MYDQPPQLPAVRQSTFEVSWPMIISDIPRQCKVDDVADESKNPPAARGDGEKVSAVNPLTLKISSQREDIGEIAMRLLRDSWNIFKDLTLRDWADDVLHVPSTKVEHLRLCHNQNFQCFTRPRVPPETVAEREDYRAEESPGSQTTRFLAPTSPSSLLNTLGKLLEAVIAKRLSYLAEKTGCYRTLNLVAARGEPRNKRCSCSRTRSTRPGISTCKAR